MVKQQRRTDRCRSAAGGSVAQVRFPVSSVQRRPLPPPPSSHQGSGRKWVGPGTGGGDSSSATTEEERGDKCGDEGPDGGSGEMKRARLDGPDESTAPSPRSCDQPGSDNHSMAAAPSEQQGAAEHSDDNRAAELQSVGSLKVTIQQRSESREFRQTTEKQTGLHCHVCKLSCRSLQVFHEHMSGAEHMKKLQEITHSISLNTHTLQQDRGRRPDAHRWCDTCQTHFSSDVIIHRRSKQHKMCKQMCRPFCPVCKRHFRTPRKFVEHMKSPEHKQQVHLQEVQEEELITLDAVGCFEEEEEEEDEEEEEEEADVAEGEEDDVREEEEEMKTADSADYDPDTIYGSSFVVPVSGFLCRLCNKFFHRETTARHTHCRTHTHYLNLQSHRGRGQTRTRLLRPEQEADDDDVILPVQSKLNKNAS